MMSSTAFRESSALAIGASPFRCKGLIYRDVCLDAMGTDAARRARYLEALGDDSLRQFASQIFLAGGWYDILPAARMSDAAARANGLPVEEHLQASALAAARRDVSGLYRAILKVMSPKLVAQGMIRISSRYFDFGALSIQSEESTRVLGLRTGVPAAIAHWYGTVSSAYLKCVLEQAGARDVRVEFTARASNATVAGIPICDMTFDYRWR